MRLNLLEGGNVFKGPEKQPLTQRIATGDVEETIFYIEKIIAFIKYRIIYTRIYFFYPFSNS